MISVDTILVNEQDLAKLDDLCRLCGKLDETCIPIFDENNRYNYFKVINLHFKDAFEVSKSDALPLKLCAKCLASMLSWHEFYYNCVDVEKKFRQLAEKFNLDTTKKSVGNDVEVIEVSVDGESYDFFNENTSDFDISNVNIKETSTFADTSDLSPFDDDSDNSSVKTEKLTEKLPDHSEILVEIQEKLDENTLENIKIEDVTNGSQNDLIKIEFLSMDTDTKTEHDVNAQDEPEELPKDGDKSASENSVNNAEESKVDDVSVGDFKVPRAKAKRAPRRAFRICHLCGKHYNTESGFRHHLVMHEDPSFSCHLCGSVFYEAQNLKKHLAALHSDERPFQCHLCGSKYKRKDVLQEHIKRVHEGIKRVWNLDTLKKYRMKQQAQKKYKYRCPYCDKVLGTKGYLNDHINGVHTKEELYKCNECDMTFTRKTTFKYHFKRAHILKKNVLEPRGTFLKDCEYCGLQFQIKKYYDQHVASKHLHTFKCAYCEEVFDNKYRLTKHTDTAHADMIFRCIFCSKTFGEELLLKRHVYICHSDRKPYECNECGYKANKKATLAVHIRRHTGEKPYQCDMCPRRFTQSVDYRKHRANHLKKI